MSGTFGVQLGIYEKALRWSGSWDDLFAAAARAGFAFVDISVDESPHRVARLGWTHAQRAEVRRAAAGHGVELGGLCLSVHRAVAPGSADPAVRDEALRILRAGIDLCADLGIPVLQMAGYYSYYEDPAAGARARYVDTLRAGTDHAARAGVFLGIENVDGNDITSITVGLEVVAEIGSPWLQLYPDIGNLAEQGLDVTAELAAGRARMLAIHVKDVRPGEPRRVPFGEGIVPWEDAFTELVRQRWSGRMMIEMWNDGSPASEDISARARHWIEERLLAAGMPVRPARSSDRLGTEGVPAR